ncbi:MAG: aminotransferase class I/II-fold pyridoxal phosphate-dependent enzyme, partial [Chlamydiota bacterium]
MKLPSFKLEEFWKKYEFSTPYLLCCSDPESWKLQELLKLADPESKQMWETLSLGYTEVPGHPLLRKEICKLYANIESDQVFTFAGAEEGIYCSMRTLIEPNDHIIVIDPCYQSLKTLPSSFGGQVSNISLIAENNWQLDLKEVERAFQKNTKLIVLNYPHNPTGSLLSKEVFEGIIQ